MRSTPIPYTLETARFGLHAVGTTTHSRDLAKVLKNRKLRASTIRRIQEVKTKVKAGSEQ